MAHVTTYVYAPHDSWAVKEIDKDTPTVEEYVREAHPPRTSTV